MIVAEGLSKFYGERPAISDLSFTIAKGEVVGLLGLNGAGKTTALRILSCLLLPTAGRVTVDGEDVVTHGHEIRRRVGYLPEQPPLYVEMTVAAYLAFVARLKGVPANAAKGRVADAIGAAHLGEVANQVIGTLSHGFKQRVGLAQAIVHGPALLILDEPIMGLDPVQIVEMRERIRALRGDHTILVSSHILSEISQTCDRILVLHEGRIVAEGTEEQLTALSTVANRLVLEVRMAPEDAERVVASVEGVTSREVRPHAGGTLEITVAADRDVREDLARAIVGAGGGLLGLGPAEAELESIFVQLTRGATRGEAS